MNRAAKTLLEGAVMVMTLLAAGGAAAAVPAVKETLEPADIAVGDAATLTVTRSGEEPSAITPPMVPGLDFTAVSQSQQVESINGVESSTMSITYQVVAQQAGVYLIPAVDRGAQALTLRVAPGARGSASAAGVSAPTTSTAAGAFALPAGATRLAASGAAFVRLRLPKHQLYVGESIPVAIQVGTRDGMVASLNGAPVLNGDAFALDPLSAQPTRSAETIDGKPFTVFTWRSVLSAVKPGELALTMETPLTVRIQSAQPPSGLLDDSMLSGFFNDPTFRNFFGGTTEKEVTVTSAPATFTVRALPTEGKPDDFSGAVGRFKIASEVTDRQVNVADPTTLRVTVSGEGNFDRVSTPMLRDAAPWKTYQPTGKFTSSDGTTYRGEKIFEQPLLATRTGVQIVPSVTFSYFDPDRGHYEVARSQPLEVTVTGTVGASVAQLNSTPGVAAAGTPANSPTGGWAPDHAVGLHQQRSLDPDYFRPGYLALPSLLVLAFPGAWLFLRRREQHADEQVDPRQTRDRRHFVRDLDRAVQRGDSQEFFQLARERIQLILGARWHIASQAVTATEVAARLGADGEIQRLLARADEAMYANQGYSRSDLDNWRRIVLRNVEEGSPV